MSTTHVLTLLETLQDHPGVGGTELARRLGVDRRTVRRYVTKLQELGIPVEAERGRYGGYRLRPGYKLPPLMLTDDEATAVVLGLIGARQLGLTDGEAALAKIERVLPGLLRERVKALEDVLGFTHEPPDGAPPETATLLALADAVRRRRRVRVNYRSWKGTQSQPELEPYGLVLHNGRWYLSAGAGEPRTYRVDRISDVRLLRETAQPPEGFDPVDHVSRSLARVPWKWEVEVLLDTTLDEARARVPRTAAELEPNDGRVLMRGRAENLDGMARILAGLGFDFEILKPDELRAAVRKLGRRLVDTAG
jgi:predicted DNA-binding transcriptional regulator YafY